MKTSTPRPSNTDSAVAVSNTSRRNFLTGAAALTVSAAAGPRTMAALVAPAPHPNSTRILVGSGTPDGILSFAWDVKTGSLTPEGVAAKISHSTWLDVSPDRRFLYVACELDEFEGKPTGSVASFGLSNGKLTAISNVSAQGKGTCHLATDHTGKVVICANYAGGTASSYLSNAGKLGDAAWNERYTGYPDGKAPVPDRQEQAHAHFASLSPDNRFAYINDLGADKIHIYKLDTATAKLTPAGAYAAKPGDGPRTLHFHPNGKVAYCINELNSSVTVLQYNAADGTLSPIQNVSLSPRTKSDDGRPFSNTACDAVLTRDGKFAYFANRGDDFIMGFHIAADGKLTEFPSQSRIWSGGTTPRNFTLDPTERWMLVANQVSSNLSVFARDPATGILSSKGTNTPAATPMCIVFV